MGKRISRKKERRRYLNHIDETDRQTCRERARGGYRQKGIWQHSTADCQDVNQRSSVLLYDRTGQDK